MAESSPALGEPWQLLMNASVARSVNRVASIGEAPRPEIFKRGVIEPLIGEATEVAVSPATPLFSAVRLRNPCFLNALMTASLVANSAYWSTRLVNLFGSAVGESLDRHSGWLGSESCRVASFDQISGLRYLSPSPETRTYESNRQCERDHEPAHYEQAMPPQDADIQSEIDSELL